MVCMQVTQDELVEVLIRDHVSGEILHGARSNIEDQLVSIAKLHQEARCGLAVA